MRQVLDGIADGEKNHEIGQRLQISPKTVEKHRAALYQEFRCDNAVTLVLLALRQGIIRL